MWTDTRIAMPPLLGPDINSGCENASVRVLGVVFGEHKIVVLEQWDEDSPAQWYSCCSEHWNLGDRVTHWQYLPQLPEGV